MDAIVELDILMTMAAIVKATEMSMDMLKEVTLDMATVMMVDMVTVVMVDMVIDDSYDSFELVRIKIFI